MRPDNTKTMLDAGCWMPDRDIEYQISRIQYPPATKRDCLRKGFALYEVLLGVTVFVIGVLALGRAVENCLNASALSAEEDRVRQILSNRMSEIQATPGLPDAAKESKIDSGYGIVKLVQKTAPAKLTEQDGTDLNGINLVTLTAQWSRGGVTQAKSIEFYVYRAG
jgi:Tfp pilus assembly protein PilV